jgi:hypothetical protein
VTRRLQAHGLHRAAGDPVAFPDFGAPALRGAGVVGVDGEVVVLMPEVCDRCQCVSSTDRIRRWLSSISRSRCRSKVPGSMTSASPSLVTTKVLEKPLTEKWE